MYLLTSKCEQNVFLFSTRYYYRDTQGVYICLLRFVIGEGSSYFLVEGINAEEVINYQPFENSLKEVSIHSHIAYM